MRPAGEPRFDLGCLVGCVVIHDDMNIEAFRDLGVDLFEKLQELDRPVTLVAFADDKPRGDIERGKQRGRTMPHIWGNSELQGVARRMIGHIFRNQRSQRVFRVTTGSLNVVE